MEDFKVQVGYTILDPFVGSGTSSLVCKRKDINSIGFDILAMSKIDNGTKISDIRRSLKPLLLFAY
ncbi:hypothetical protein ATZ36_07585 [Candidatus Endomicrobiellum trichonymphae]|uniref:DNA methylase N-4/N-6 domain-containing protein n=1 Tax=Endomicrobium trichonymphae TaxID=1408204 RepID=A0A1E5IGY0_ENDTX|nr:hypothetical protein ATZ36_07585 [Candidatus Endomicrobium trichonymphae]